MLAGPPHRSGQRGGDLDTRRQLSVPGRAKHGLASMSRCLQECSRARSVPRASGGRAFSRAS